MSHDIFKQRGDALEGQFFRRIDDELAIKLKEKWQHERDIESLRKESHIQDDAVLEELLYVGIQPGTLQAMTLVPAIHVAWANGYVENKERDAVIHAAKNMGIDTESSPGQLLTSWLKHKPTSELFQAWEDYIKALKGIINVVAYRHLHESAINTAENIAKSAGGMLGVLAISFAEQQAIKQIDEAFL
ncbi:MAG: hypothetical protein WAO83_20905 [Fuerstiella sp.]